MSFNYILVPFDASKLSIKAVKQAIELAKENTTQIFILHVINEIPLPIRFSKIESKDNEVVILPLVNKIYEELRTDMIPILEELKNRYNTSNVSIITEIKVGDPAETIIDFTKHKNIDLIIMGSVGLRGISGMIKKLGSIARKVSEEVSCPVLLVR